jgi:malonyl-CoA decarboxylase
MDRTDTPTADGDAPAAQAPNGGGFGLRSLWQRLKSRAVPEARPLSARTGQRLRQILDESANGIGGEISARDRAAEAAMIYATLSDPGKQAFFELLLDRYGPDTVGVELAIARYQAASGARDARGAALALRRTLAAPSSRIFTHFTSLPDGVKFLVDLRQDLIRATAAQPGLAPLDDELRGLFARWFDVGFLRLERITWNSPASLLEKLISYEAVHEIRSWTDLRHRLDSDRRCYAFFHPRMPEEPLVFVEVALTREIASGIHELLDETKPPTDPARAEVAVFYSISNTQKGLRGVSFGGFLIKRVVEQLRAELPKLGTFVTLSPLPDFRRWLDRRIAAHDPALVPRSAADAVCAAAQKGDPAAALGALLAVEDWPARPDLAAALAGVVPALGARYLLDEKLEGRPLDPVARFHLGNGARLERINWLADTGKHGLARSAGLMVNYLYRLDEIEENHEAYARDGRIAASHAVRRLLRDRS